MKKISFFVVLAFFLVSVAPASAFWKDYGVWWGGNDLCRGGYTEAMCKPPLLPPELGQNLSCNYYHSTTGCCCQGLVWAPDRPEVTATVSGNSIRLSWNEDPGANSYGVYWGDNPDFKWFDERYFKVDGNSFTHNNLNYNTDYYYVVIAWGTYGDRVSQEVKATTGTEPAPAPAPSPDPPPSTWEEFDNNPATNKIVADGVVKLCKLHNNGELWCNSSWGGWELLDSNPATIDLRFHGCQLLKLHNNGEIWYYNKTCWGHGCPEPGTWVMLDSNPDTTMIANGRDFYKLHKDGSIWLYDRSDGPWEQIDNNPATTAIEAEGNDLYQLHDDGSILRYNYDTGGWDLLDNNPATVSIEATATTLYQLQNTGAILRYNLPSRYNDPVDHPGEWVLVDNDPATIKMVASLNSRFLFKLKNNGELWFYSSLTGVWEPLDNNPAIVDVDAQHHDVFELLNDGKIRHLVLP
jgi:hypothetical protein